MVMKKIAAINRIPMIEPTIPSALPKRWYVGGSRELELPVAGVGDGLLDDRQQPAVGRDEEEDVHQKDDHEDRDRRAQPEVAVIQAELVHLIDPGRGDDDRRRDREELVEREAADGARREGCGRSSSSPRETSPTRRRSRRIRARPR